MIRKTAVTLALMIAMTFGGFVGSADADPTATPTPRPTPVVCTEAGYNGCVAYPEGGFGNGNPTATPTPKPQPTATPAPTTEADAAAAAAAANASPAQIAFTGSESRVLGYAGAGLIGFGAVALAAARRKHEETNE